jgi:hypothetical protein
MIPLLTGWSAVPFHAMVLLQIAAAVEEVIISLLIPRHVGEMATVWHALRLRRQNRAAADIERRPSAPVHR